MPDMRSAVRPSDLRWEWVSSVDSFHGVELKGPYSESDPIPGQPDAGYAAELLSGHGSFERLLMREHIYWPFYSADIERRSFVVKALVVEEEIAVSETVVPVLPAVEPERRAKPVSIVNMSEIRRPSFSDIVPKSSPVAEVVPFRIGKGIGTVSTERSPTYRKAFPEEGSITREEHDGIAETTAYQAVAEPEAKMEYGSESVPVSDVPEVSKPILSSFVGKLFLAVRNRRTEAEGAESSVVSEECDETLEGIPCLSDSGSEAEYESAPIPAGEEPIDRKFFLTKPVEESVSVPGNEPFQSEEVASEYSAEDAIAPDRDMQVAEARPAFRFSFFRSARSVTEETSEPESGHEVEPLPTTEETMETVARIFPSSLGSDSFRMETEEGDGDGYFMESVEEAGVGEASPRRPRISEKFAAFRSSFVGRLSSSRASRSVADEVMESEYEPETLSVPEESVDRGFESFVKAASVDLGSDPFRAETEEVAEDSREDSETEEVVPRRNAYLSEKLASFRSILSEKSASLFGVLEAARVGLSVPTARWATIVSVFLIVLGGGTWTVHRVVSFKGQVLGESVEGVSLASKAVKDLTAADFNGSSENFIEAYQTFSDASDSLGAVGNELAKATRFIPGLSKVSSGQGLLEGAKYLSAAGVSMSNILKLLPSSGDGKDTDISFLDLIDEAEKRSSVAVDEIAAAQAAFDRVRPEDVPEDKREAFVSIRAKLPVIAAALNGFNRNSHLVRELLGENGPRMYLFLFQNNAELRPTGGFIGSYGLLKVDQGHIGKFFVDGIFNPDGQFKENIVPPTPIQKVSAAWSLHDSNWWPDFPASAEKAISFYEKTGGPTVDGVITLTPTVIRKLLHLTGPIDMPEYGVTIDENNFAQVVQEEVEEKYDRKLNRPKKILSDLAPVLLERLFSMRSASLLTSLAETFSQALDEKHILLYSRNGDVEQLVDQAGWSGKVLDTPRDYLSVIHTNLNGYKTDAVVKENIEHSAVVQADGSILDTVRITRKHTGGDSRYDWFNRVNTDYLRVYVPQGSELVSASGQTYEFPKAPINYDALGFRRDDDVEREEKATLVDKGGTRISEESGKTVFGNWVYVSPGESVTVEYTYRLPFRISPQAVDPASYSVLFQKQSGSEGSSLRSRFSFPDRFRIDWHSDGLTFDRNGYSFAKTLSTDAYYGAVLSAQ